MKFLLLILLPSLALAQSTYTYNVNVGANGGSHVPVYRYIDMVGSAGRSYQKPSKMIDGFNQTDPGNSSPNFTGKAGDTFCFPEKQFPEYYPNGAVKDLVYPNMQNCTILDMTGAVNDWDTAQQVNIKSVYAAENSTEIGDSVQFYNVDFWMANPTTFYQYLSNPTSMTPFAVVATSNKTRQWTSVLCNTTCRYVLVRGSLKSRGAYSTTPFFTSFEFYGIPTGGAVTLRALTVNYAGPVGPSKKQAAQTYDKFSGTNIPGGQGPTVLQYHGAVRCYGGENYWVTNASGLDTASSTFTYDYFSDIGPTQYAAFKAAGQKFWWTMKGVRKAYQNTYGNGTVDIDHKTDNPTNPMAWTVAGQWSFYYAAKHGAVAVSTLLTPHWNVNTGNGLNDVSIVEPNNEEDFQGVIPIVTVNKMSAWYDGYQGRLGVQAGVKSADPNFFLMYPGMVEQDTDLVRSVIWLAHVTRTDHKIPWDGFNYHHYPRTNNDIVGNVDCNLRPGATARSAEKDKINTNNQFYCKFIYNALDGDTSKLIYNTESGYGNWGSVSNDGTFSCNVNYDDGNAKGITIPGFDSLQSKAIVQQRLELKLQASPLAGYNDFFFSNSDYGANTYTLYQDYGMTTGHNGTTFEPTTYFPWYYFHASAQTILKGYYVDSVYGGVLADDTGLNIIRYRSLTKTDTAVYAVWKGTTSGTTIASQSLTIPGLVGTTVSQYTPSLTTAAPTVSTASAPGGTLPYTATETPVFYAAKVGAAPVNTYQTLKLYRR